MNGFLCIDKPEGPSSFFIIKKLRSILKIKKIGHSGTLDPQASGLLICALGRATRLLSYVPGAPKEYHFAVRFGTTTDTLDREGAVLHCNGPIPSREDIQKVLSSFIGEISQTPPRFSAIKVNGIPAYKMARNDQTFDLKARRVSVYALDLCEYDSQSGIADFKVECSAGTYVRSLAADIAGACKTYGYAHSIRRTRIGPHEVGKALNFERMEECARDYILPIKDFFDDYPAHTASQEQIMLLRNGRDIKIPECEGQKAMFVYDPDDQIVAVTRFTGEDTYRPLKVFGVK